MRASNVSISLKIREIWRQGCQEDIASWRPWRFNFFLVERGFDPFVALALRFAHSFDFQQSFHAGVASHPSAGSRLAQD
jgi:hypothetical protein